MESRCGTVLWCQCRGFHTALAHKTDFWAGYRFRPNTIPTQSTISLPFNNFLPIDWQSNRSRKLYSFELKLYVPLRALMLNFLVASPNIKEFSYWN